MWSLLKKIGNLLQALFCSLSNPNKEDISIKLNECSMQDVKQFKSKLQDDERILRLTDRQIVREFVGELLNIDPYSITLEEMRNLFIDADCYTNEKPPKTVDGFIKEVLNDYLRFEKAPSEAAMEIIEIIIKDLHGIEENINRCNEKDIELPDNVDQVSMKNYWIGLLKRKKKLNEEAKIEIIDFLSNQLTRSAWIRSQKVPIGSINLSFGIDKNLYNFQRFRLLYDPRGYSHVFTRLRELSPKKALKWAGIYRTNPDKFYSYLDEYTKEKELHKQIHNLLDNHHSFAKRCEILSHALACYNTDEIGDIVFIHLIVPQIEGLFREYATEIGIDIKDDKMNSFANTLDRIAQNYPWFEKSDYSYFEYFRYDFRELRNHIAHGNSYTDYRGNSVKPHDLANELLIDLSIMGELLTEKRLHTNRIISIARKKPNEIENNDLIVYAYLLNHEIPQFYELDESRELVTNKLAEDSFLSYLKDLLKENNQIIDAGVKKILIDLKSSGIFTNQVEEILKMHNFSGSYQDPSLDVFENEISWIISEV